MKLVDRKTGALVDIPDNQAQAAFMSGKFGVPKGSAMPVKVAGLDAGTVDAKDAAAAFHDGARAANEGEFRKAQQAARYGGVGGAIEAGAVGAARGAAGAFGVPLDQVAVGAAELGDQIGLTHARQEIDPYQGARSVSTADDMRARLAGLQEQHGVASTLGELGGMAATLATGGGVMGRVGAAAEELGGVGGKFLGSVARNAAEGAYMGGIGGANEAALGPDHEAIASKVMAGMGHGAIVGGALGGALHLGTEALAGARDKLGRWASTVRPQDIEKVAEGQFGHAPKGLGEKIQETYARMSSAASGKDEGLIRKFTELSPEGAEARRIAVFDAPKIQEEAERAVRKHIDELMSSGDLVAAEARGGLKADYVKKAVARGNEAEVQGFASSKIGSILEGAQAQLDAEMAPTMLKSVETTSKLAYAAQEAIAGGDNAAAFVALDNMKRGVQRLTSTGYRSLRAIADPVDQLNAKRTVAWLDGVAADLRSSLEDQKLWGKAAIDQREINAAWTKQIDASKRFHRSLTTEVGRDPANPYIELRGADPAKVSSYVKNLTNPNNDLTHKAVRDYVESTGELADAIGRSYDLPADKLAEVGRVKDAASSFKGAIDKAENSLVTANQYQQLMGGPEAGTVAGALGTVGGIVGGLPGGILGTVAGGAMNTAKQPARVIAQMAALERITSSVDNDIARGVKSFLSGGKEAATKALEPAASVEMLAGKGGPRKVFESKVKEIQQLAGNKEELLARTQSFTSQFSEAAPNVATALTAATIKGVDYLAKHAPPGFQQRPEALEWGIKEEPLYTDAEMREWSRRAAVVNDPREVLRSMKKKMLTPEEVDALKEVHQPIFQQMQREFKRQAIEKPQKFNYSQSLQIELTFGTPLTRTLDPDFMKAVQASFAVQETKPRPRSNGVTGVTSRAVGTASERLRGL